MSAKLQTTRWAFDLNTWSPNVAQLALAIAAIQTEERSRLIKFYFINDFLSSLVGRLLMRKYVSQCTQLPYHEIKFARDARGKPYWLNHIDESQREYRQQLQFNVSHQGNFVILAGVHSAKYEDVGIGCDVMKLEYSGGKDLKEFFRIMHRKFADSEWRYITQPNFNQQQQLKAFMRHWCLKEAYVKELGVGINVDLQKIEFSVDDTRELGIETPTLGGATLKCNDIPMHNWNFEEHMLHPKYCAAIAFRNYQPEFEEKFKFLDIDDLLRPSELADSSEIIEYCRTALRKQWK
ncbi:L-aminoadipate-semialdehyde dehydrogenase-phosphopantetheinyl transferase [Haematobia irritans]|uniref:L-aminoadipate-semialdehyde dehydrogenase-phosphopantetheinyl transferase n=1 Tax=Haematobia irritans TaxID=7368 RepID=UPI003F4FA6F2